MLCLSCIYQKEGGRLDSCVPTNNGHYYRSKYVVAWVLLGWV